MQIFMQFITNKMKLTEDDLIEKDQASINVPIEDFNQLIMVPLQEEPQARAPVVVRQGERSLAQLVTCHKWCLCNKTPETRENRSSSS